MMLIVTSKHTTETLTNEFLVFSLADTQSACRLNQRSVTHTELLVRPKQRITDDAAYLPATLSALCVSTSVMKRGLMWLPTQTPMTFQDFTSRTQHTWNFLGHTSKNVAVPTDYKLHHCETVESTLRLIKTVLTFHRQYLVSLRILYINL